MALKISLTLKEKGGGGMGGATADEIWPVLLVFLIIHDTVVVLCVRKTPCDILEIPNKT